VLKVSQGHCVLLTGEESPVFFLSLCVSVVADDSGVYRLIFPAIDSPSD